MFSSFCNFEVILTTSSVGSFSSFISIWWEHQTRKMVGGWSHGLGEKIPLSPLISSTTSSSKGGGETDRVKKEKENKNLLFHSPEASALRWDTPTPCRWLQGQAHREGTGCWNANLGDEPGRCQPIVSWSKPDPEPFIYRQPSVQMLQPEWLLTLRKVNLGAGLGLGWRWWSEALRFTGVRHMEGRDWELRKNGTSAWGEKSGGLSGDTKRVSVESVWRNRALKSVYLLLITLASSQVPFFLFRTSLPGKDVLVIASREQS